MIAAALATLLLMLSACGHADLPPLVRTISLAHPEDTVSAFEPFVAIDARLAEPFCTWARSTGWVTTGEATGSGPGPVKMEG